MKLLLFIMFLVRPSTFSFMGWSGRHLYFSDWRRTFACRLCCIGCIASVCSMNVMGVDFIAPVMMRSAWFWILSRDFWLVFAVVDHAVELYYRTGLTDPSYTVLSICSLAHHVCAWLPASCVPFPLCLGYAASMSASCRKLHKGKWLGLLLSECVYQS